MNFCTRLKCSFHQRCTLVIIYHSPRRRLRHRYNSHSWVARSLIRILNELQKALSEYRFVFRDSKNFKIVPKDLRNLAQVCGRIGSYESLAQRAKLEALKCRALTDPYIDKIAQFLQSLREDGSGDLSRDDYRKLH